MLPDEDYLATAEKNDPNDNNNKHCKSSSNDNDNNAAADQQRVGWWQFYFGQPSLSLFQMYANVGNNNDVAPATAKKRDDTTHANNGEREREHDSSSSFAFSTLALDDYLVQGQQWVVSAWSLWVPPFF
jgi:hypothetical protein